MRERGYLSHQTVFSLSNIRQKDLYNFHMYDSDRTIKKSLDHIASNKYVLPAIQREFVWSPKQICMLFDSVMQGYPFGEFLFWRRGK